MKSRNYRPEGFEVAALSYLGSLVFGTQDAATLIIVFVKSSRSGLFVFVHDDRLRPLLVHGPGVVDLLGDAPGNLLAITSDLGPLSLGKITLQDLLLNPDFDVVLVAGVGSYQKEKRS